MERLEDRCLLAAQVIQTMPAAQSVDTGSSASFDVEYSTQDPVNAATTGLTLRMHYNSTELTPDISAIAASAFAGATIQDTSEPDGGPLDLPKTDRYVNFLWFDLDGEFPGKALPLTLFTASFATTELFDGESVQFTADPPVGFEFVSTPAVLTASVLLDYGDAPDDSVGTGPEDYRTQDKDDGPSHVIVNGLFLGASVDGVEPGDLNNDRANADDVDGALPDDEDGVLDPLDLQGTEGTAPTVTVLATNTTGSDATLYGWIDYNQNGVFDNATERAQATVSDGTTNGRFTLTFPAIPSDSAGTTYARFRLSTDTAAANSIGPASDGEVEDYVFTISTPSSATVDHSLTLAHNTNGGPTLADSDTFGSGVANVGDLDGDGVADLAVGAQSDDTGGNNRGAVHVLLLNADGTVKGTTKIASDTGGGPTLSDGDSFGNAVIAVGDLDGDGVIDLAVGAESDDDGFSPNRGAVWILFMNSNGTARAHQKISDLQGSFTGILNGADRLGGALAAPGDLNGDGIADLVVGARGDDDGAHNSGAVWVMFLNANGTVASHQKISLTVGEFSGELSEDDAFGRSVTSIGDLDGDGVADLAVGATGDDTGGNGRGAIHVILLNADGTVKSSTKIASETNGGPALANGDNFGRAVTGGGDLDGDGINDLIVGANADDTGGPSRGAVYVLLLNSDGTVKGLTPIANETGGGPSIADGDNFGRAVTGVGDLNGDGIPDLAVGATGDDTGGDGRGAVHVLFLDGDSEPEPEDVTLPGAGGGDPIVYEVLRDGADLVVRVKGGAEVSRQTAAGVSVLQITGTDENDMVTVLDSGTAVSTPITFTGGNGNDQFDGTLAAGVLVLNGNGGNDVLIGGSANDSLNGGSGADELVGNGGDDRLRGQGSTGDTLDAGDGDDTLDGGSGNDVVRETFAGDVLLTNSAMKGRGNDTVISVERAELFGGGAAQTIDVSAFFTLGLTSTIIKAGGGDDVFIGSGGNDRVSGEGGSDRLEGGEGADRMLGGSGADTLIGGAGDDLLKGLGGSGDQLTGGDGDDTLNGGRGVDRIVEGADVDFVLTAISMTGLGTDKIQAMEIADLTGGASDNVIDISGFIPGRGSTRINGGGGNDSIIGSNGRDILNGGDGDDTLLGKAGDDLLNGDAGADRLSGHDGNDELNGGDFHDIGYGGTGNDTLNGGRGFDILFGGDDDDEVNGGNGVDTLVGGQGDNDPTPGTDMFDNLGEVDEAFLLNPLPGWVDQV